MDACVSTLILEALSPSAIDVSLQVAEDIELERQQLHESWNQWLERADYETKLARRRYEVSIPTIALLRGRSNETGKLHWRHSKRSRMITVERSRDSQSD